MRRALLGAEKLRQTNVFETIRRYLSRMPYSVTDLLQSGGLAEGFKGAFTDVPQILSEFERVLLLGVEKGKFLPRHIVIRF
jgi:hypothetical protein